MLDVVSNIICSLYMPLCFYLYFPKRVSGIRKVITCMCCALIMLGMSYVSITEILLPIIFVMMGVFLVLGCKIRIKELWIIIASYTQCTLSCVFIDFVFMELMKLLRINLDMDVRQLCVVLMSSMFIIICSCLLKKMVERIRNIDSKYSGGVVIIVTCNIVLLTALVMINNWVARINNWNSTIERVNIIIFVTYTIIMIFVMFFVVRIFKEKDRMKHDKQQYENLLEYSSQIESMYTDLRGFKHDYVNIMSTMSEYFETKDYEGLEKYFNDNIIPIGKKFSTDNYRLNQLKNIKNVAIKGLISSKLIHAHEIGIDVYIDIIEPIENFGINDIDSARMMGILLDNAIEAVKECETKKIRFNIAKSDSNVCIVIANTYNTECKISLSQINKKGFSTKGESRGMGLYNVDMILAKYNNIFKQTKIEDEFFIQQIEVDIKKM